MLSERGPPKDYDIPSTIVIYIVVIMLGIGMCFCLRRANRLLPNQRSFQLRPTATTRRRGYDIADEEEGDPESRMGLLSAGYDHDEEEEEEEDRYINRRRLEEDYGIEDDEEEFGAMQGAPSSPPTTSTTTSPPLDVTSNRSKSRTPLFNIADEDDSDTEQKPQQLSKKDKIK
ncbi:hypothetical protein BDA99DRAFT_493235 [Phascolomyces articulosus]|uniref:Uncharacterized protein n=1 Tax=Phascolomyces articulosus TaxID=60185 RepID=A0AAD5PK52_9FUNG|nr:hypothetical protein BDA99DRAFT_493235 [Phascolomyces articulosus]